MRACRTCRHRRIWCDTALPACGRCSDSGRQCGGYDDAKHNVFVNFDSNNISGPKKKIRGAAIKRASALDQARCRSLVDTKDQSDVESFLEGNELRRLSIDSLFMAAGDFRNHFEQLWDYFQSNYKRTLDSYTVGYSQLVLQNKALDIALIALSTQRLSISASDPQVKVMSLTAYHHSLRLYQHIMQTKRQAAASLLVLISFVFTLFEGAEQTPEKIYSSVPPSHLKGALSILQMQDPESYSVDGYHEIFRKIRELTIHHSLSTRSSTFLSQEEWMTKPWSTIKKTWRDRLHDIAMQMTDIMAYVQGSMLLEATPDIEKRKRMAEQCRSRWVDLINWRREWLQKAYPDIHVTCSEDCTVCYCSLPASDFPESNFAHLQVEHWSLLLTLGIVSCDLRASLPAEEVESVARPNISDDLELQLPLLADLVHKALDEPFFGQVLKNTPGVTEGRCRSLFPLWALSQHRTSIFTEATEGEWWSGLSQRLNYGEPNYKSPYVSPDKSLSLVELGSKSATVST